MGLFSRDHSKTAAQLEERGELAKAAGHWAKAGEIRRATLTAAKAADAPAAIRFAFQAALGREAAVPDDANLRQAGEMLQVSGMLAEALALFELGKAYDAAGEVAVKLKDQPRAAKYFEWAKEWDRAAAIYEQLGKPQDAVRNLERESKRLATKAEKDRDAAAAAKRREVDGRRARLLSELGKSDAAAEVVKGEATTHSAAQILEQGGRYVEAAEAWIELGENERAAQAVRRIHDLDPIRTADLLQRCGQTQEAARLLARQGKFREAADLYLELGEWPAAAGCFERAGCLREAAGAYGRSGNYAESARCFQEAGDPALAAESLARAGRLSDAVTMYIDLGEPDRAADFLIRKHQYVEAAKCYLKSGTKEAAIDALGRVPEGSEQFHPAVFMQVPLLIEKGRLAEALVTVRRIADDPHQVGEAALERIYWEGSLFARMGKVERAFDRFQTLNGYHPGFRDVEEQMAKLQADHLVTRLDSASAAPVAAPGASPGSPTQIATRLGPDGSMPQGYLLASRYRIGKELGQGGMGRVYEAHDGELDETVAIKTVLRRGNELPEVEARLLREVQICRKIAHPNIVRVHDIGRFEGGIFLTMERLQGHSLEQRLVAGPQRSFAETKTVLEGILSGLAAAHELGVIHRDLKPDNIFIDQDRVKILDFGIAHMKDSGTRLTMTGKAIGTPLYMSPEQLQGQTLDPRSDLYSVGIVAFRMLTGRCPFEAEAVGEIVLHHMQTPPPALETLRPDAPDLWSRWIATLLAKNRDDRPASTGAALEQVRLLPA